MPIIIVQGANKHNTKRSIVNHDPTSKSTKDRKKVSSPGTSDDDENDRIPDLTADMSEVLNLKVYKVSKPNFIDGTTTTTLIGGDIFYQGDEDASRIQKATTLENENESKTKSSKTAKVPSLLQNIRAYKYVSTRFQKDEKSILDIVKENNQKFKMIKAGQSLAEHLPHPSVDEVLIWAIEYVNAHEHNLATHFIHLEERIKCHMDERLIQNGKQLPLLKSAGDATPNRYRTTPGLVQNTDMFGKPAKALSLVQQLENMKNQGTDAFLKSVMVTSESSYSQRKSDNNLKNLSTGKGSSKKDGTPMLAFEPSKPQQSRKSNQNSFRQRSSRLQVNADDSAIIENQDIVPASSKDLVSDPANDELQPVFESNENETDDGMNSQPLDTHEDLEDTPSSTKPNETDKDNKDCAVRAPTLVTSTTPLTQKKVAINAKSSKPPLGVKYSNAKIESPSPSNDGKINVATQEAIDDMKRTQMLFVKSLGYTMNIFKKANEKQQALEKKTQKRLQRANLNGNNLFQEFTSFRTSKSQSDKNVEHSLQDREYHRGQTFEAKSSIFSNNEVDFASSGGNIHDDMKRLRQTAREYTEKKHISLILDIKWFISALNRLRDYMRRMNNLAPPCCLKFLSILEQMIYLSFIIDAAIFYKILLSDIFVRDDYRKNVVHQLIDVVREGLGIPPEEFVKFLESHDLQVPPELMNLVRSNAQVSQKPSIREKRESPGVPKMGSISFSTDVVVFEEPAIILNHPPEEIATKATPQETPSVKRIPIPPPIIISDLPLENKHDGLMIVSDEC